MHDDLIRSELLYDPATGEFTWNKRIEGSRGARIFNARFAGKSVGYISVHGYTKIKFHGRSLLAHRVAWFLHYGVWPSRLLDHIDGNRSNNAIENLREATDAQNCQNRRVKRNSVSGVKGVFQTPAGNWGAGIVVNRQRIHLGRFASIDDAAAAYSAAAERYFGEFARVG